VWLCLDECDRIDIRGTVLRAINFVLFTPAALVALGLHKAMVHRILRPGTPCTRGSSSLGARRRLGGQDTTSTTRQGC